MFQINLRNNHLFQKCHSIHLAIVAIKPWTTMSSFTATSCFIQGNLKGLQNWVQSATNYSYGKLVLFFCFAK